MLATLSCSRGISILVRYTILTRPPVRIQTCRKWTYVVYVQDKPFGALSEVAFGLNIVVDDDRLHRRINQWQQSGRLNLDVPMANIKSASSIMVLWWTGLDEHCYTLPKEL